MDDVFHRYIIHLFQHRISNQAYTDESYNYKIISATLNYNKDDIEGSDSQKTIEKRLCLQNGRPCWILRSCDFSKVTNLHIALEPLNIQRSKTYWAESWQTIRTHADTLKKHK